MKLIKEIRRAYTITPQELAEEFCCPTGGDCPDCVKLVAEFAQFGDYDFYLFQLDSGAFVVDAGCRPRMSTDDYRAHVARTYPNYKSKAAATLAILADFDATIAELKQSTQPGE